MLVAQMADVPIDQLFTLNPGYNRWATSPDGPYSIVLPVEGAELLEASLETINPSVLMRWDQVVVQNGDTLSEISARHHVPVSVLRTSNKLQGDTIHVGQKLRLPRDDQLMVDPRYAQAAMELQNLQSGLIAADRVTHRVRQGESLSVIARRYRVSVSDLQRWNNISDPRRLRAGKTITVFYSPADQRPATGGISKYVVRRGDSLWSIATQAQRAGGGLEELERPRQQNHDPARPVHQGRTINHGKSTPPDDGRHARGVFLLTAVLPLRAALELTGEGDPGRIDFWESRTRRPVRLDDTDVLVSPAGEFVIGFGRDETGEKHTAGSGAGRKRSSLTFPVNLREYRIERVDGLPPKTVTPDPEAAARIREEGARWSPQHGPGATSGPITQTGFSGRPAAASAVYTAASVS